MGFANHCHLTPLRSLIHLGQLFASGFFQIRSHPRHPCLWLTLPLAWCVEDLHLQVTSVATTPKLVALARNPPCLAHHESRTADGSPRSSFSAQRHTVVLFLRRGVMSFNFL